MSIRSRHVNIRNSLLVIIFIIKTKRLDKWRTNQNDKVPIYRLYTAKTREFFQQKYNLQIIPRRDHISRYAFLAGATHYIGLLIPCTSILVT